MTSCVDVFKSATSVKSMYMTKIVIENQKNRENRNQRNFFYINLHPIDGLRMEFTARYVGLMPRGSADIK